MGRLRGCEIKYTSDTDTLLVHQARDEAGEEAVA